MIECDSIWYQSERCKRERTSITRKSNGIDGFYHRTFENACKSRQLQGIEQYHAKRVGARRFVGCGSPNQDFMREPSDSSTSLSTSTMEQEAEVTLSEANDTVSEITLTQQEKEILHKQRTRAMGFLCLSLTEMVKPYILNTFDPAVAWEILANVYFTKTIVGVMKILDKRKNLKMTEDMSVSILYDIYMIF